MAPLARLASMSPVSICSTSRKGKYGSPMPAWALHFPPATIRFLCAAIARRANSPINTVLPLPASPVTKATRPWPASARSRKLFSFASSRARATNGAGVLGSGGAGVAITPPLKRPSRICSYSAVVSFDGSTPSSSASRRRQVSYWARAALRRPLSASRRINCRWASSSQGSRASSRRAYGSARLYSPRAAWIWVRRWSADNICRSMCSCLKSSHSSNRGLSPRENPSMKRPRYKAIADCRSFWSATDRWVSATCSSKAAMSSQWSLAVLNWRVSRLVSKKGGVASWSPMARRRW